MKKDKLLHKALFTAITILVLAVIFLWQGRIDLSKTNKESIQDFYIKLSNSQVAFTDAGEFVFPDEQKFLDLKSQYISDGENFVEIDLRAMRGALYDKGEKIKEFPVLAKGRQGTWWETPTGSYRVINKEYLHFSKLAKVWMPYSTQFYGSFFIHGWPFYENGTPIPSTVSGSLGCIRLSGEDAKAVFDFTQIGTRVLVLEDEPVADYGLLTVRKTSTGEFVPSADATAILAANLATGETILKKNISEILPLGPLTKFMTAVSAADLLNPDQEIKISISSLAEILTLFQPKIGEKYTVLDLLYPLLMQSSDEAALILADFIGEENLVINMNSKKKSLQMTETKFVDFRGNSSANVSTVQDLLKLLQHVFYKRSFLFDISRGKEYFNVGPKKFGISNLNSFYQDEGLIGIQGGKTFFGKENMMSVWRISGLNEQEAPIAIIVLDSEDAASDTQNIFNWVKNNFEVL